MNYVISKRFAPDSAGIAPNETVTISVDIENTGNMQATEIPNLFLRDEWASMVRPSMELYGFARVTLARFLQNHRGFDYTRKDQKILPNRQSTVTRVHLLYDRTVETCHYIFGIRGKSNYNR